MTTSIFPNFERVLAGVDVSLSGGLSKYLEKTGRLPPVSLQITPIDGSQKITLDRFLNYKFTSSIRIPVDTFEFHFVAPDDEKTFNSQIKDGDLVALFAGGQQIATGIIDTTDFESDREGGEKGAVHGRDLMGQLEDQDAISINDKAMYGNAESVSSGVKKLIENTRIQTSNLEFRDVSTRTDWLLATSPGESKLSALLRFIEPMNLLAWSGPQGQLIIGRPNMAQDKKGDLVLRKKSRNQTNVMSMKVIRSSTSIPNIILPIWSNQESVQTNVTATQRVLNKAEGPTRLRNNKHNVPKAVVVSNPSGDSPSDLSATNDLKAAGSNILYAYAKREIAKRNTDELIVQAVVFGHYNDKGEPYLPDQMYYIDFERGDVHETMFLFQVDYELSENRSQITNLYFCRIGTLVSEIKIK